MKIICNVYRVFGECRGYVVIDGKDIDGCWLGNRIYADLKEEYPDADIEMRFHR